MGVLLAELKNVYSDFTEAPEQTEKQIVQEKWLEVAKLTAECKLFNVTPISRWFYFNNMHAYPINQGFLSTFAGTYKNNDEVDVSTLPINKKGLAMLEYLFFEQDSLVNYSALVVAYIEDLEKQQASISNYWEDNLQEEFTSGKTISINDGYGELINAYVSMIEVSKKERFDKSFGLHTDQKYGFEAPYSQKSKVLFATSFSYLEYLMKAYYYDFLIAEGEETLVENMKKAFKEYKTSFSNLSGDTFEEVQETASLEELENIQDGISGILALIRIDLATAYEVLISFSDADGD